MGNCLWQRKEQKKQKEQFQRHIRMNILEKEVLKNYKVYFSSKLTEGVYPTQEYKKIMKQSASQKDESQLSTVQPQIYLENAMIHYEKEKNLADGRIKVQNCRKYPYSSIGALFFSSETKNILGSAFLITKNIVLTAAHNLYSRQSKKRYQNHVFMPTLEGEKYYGFKVKRIEYPIQYENVLNQNDSCMFDYGIMQLQQEVHQFFGYLGLDFQEKSVNYRVNAEISGYPKQIQDKNQLKRLANNMMYKGEGQVRIYSTKPGLIQHYIYTSGGQSGSPIIGLNQSVIGIHIGKNGCLGIGVLLTDEIRKRLNLWIQPEPELSLENQQINDNELKDITLTKFQNLKFENLYLLDLSKNVIQLEVSSLNQVNLKKLQILYIHENNISDKGASQLSQCEFQNLRTLSLRNNKIGQEGAEKLAKGKLGSLQVFYLGSNKIGERGANFLANGNLKNLRYFNLENNNIRSKGAKVILEGNFLQLEQLNLQNNEIGYEGPTFFESMSLKKLKKIYLGPNPDLKLHKSQLQTIFKKISEDSRLYW